MSKDPSHLDAAHPLLSLELLAVLQPVDTWGRVSRSGTTELDSVCGWNSQKFFVHPVRPRPVWCFCWKDNTALKKWKHPISLIPLLRNDDNCSLHVAYSVV